MLLSLFHLHRQLFLLQTLQHLPLLEETRTTPEMTVMTVRMRVMVKTLREMGRATMIRVTAPTTTATHLVASRAMVLV